MPIPRYRINSRLNGQDDWEWIDSCQDRDAVFRLLDQYKADAPLAEYQVIDGTTGEVLTTAVCITRPILLLLEQDGEWGLSTAGPNPPASEYVKTESKETALDIIAAYNEGDIQPFLRAAGAIPALGEAKGL